MKAVCLVILLAVLGLQSLALRSNHRSTAELQASWESLADDEVGVALHILANREPQAVIDKNWARRMLQSDRPLIRELAMTQDWTRLCGDEPQKEYLQSLEESAHATRCQLFLRRQVGTQNGITRRQFRRFMETLEE